MQIVTSGGVNLHEMSKPVFFFFVFFFFFFFVCFEKLDKKNNEFVVCGNCHESGED